MTHVLGRTRLVALTASLAMAGLVTSVAATSASAATAPTATVARPAAGGCGWTPANDSNMATSFTGQGVYIRTGNNRRCTILGEGYTSHSLTLRCMAESSDGSDPNVYSWAYVTDNTIGVTGWVGGYINWPSLAPDVC